MTPKLPILLLYGLDETSHDFEIKSTITLVNAAIDALMSRGWRVLPLQITHDLVGPLKPFDPQAWVVLNLCEGSPHQEFYYAKATRALGELGYTFTGSDAWSLDETQYKWRMKALLEQAGVSTPRWATYAQAEHFHGFEIYPAIVKPAAEHCSYGITRESVVMNDDEARKQIARIIAEFRQPAMIEEFLDSAEYNVSLLGPSTSSRSHGSHDSAQDDSYSDIRVLGISTMTYDVFDDIHDRLCTFDAKWTPESEAYQRIPAICPAPVSDELKAKIERVSIDAYRASGCRDYGRVDLRLRNNAEPMALDINSNCDVSTDGGFANAAYAAGLSYADMLENIVLMAMQRMPAYATDSQLETTQ